MERSSFFNAIISQDGTPDRNYLAEDFARFFASFIGNGIFPNPSINLQVLSNDNMTVTVNSGKAWINGYFYENTDDLILELDLADGVLSRIDRLALRLDFEDREIRAIVKKGNFESSPVPTELQRDADAYELALADIAINKGAISITQANITDLRLNTELCGIVHGTVDQVDTTTLFNQYLTWLQEKKTQYNTDMEQWTIDKQNEYEDWYDTTTTDLENEFNTWFASIQDILDENVATTILNMIDDLEDDIAEINNTLDDLSGGKGGLSSFPGGSEEITIEHGLGELPTSAYAFPRINPDGYLGEVWVRFDETNLYVGNTGSFTGEMIWGVIK